jgi:serine/threonine protein kinase
MSSQTGFPENDALPIGTRLGEFEIERVVGIGGFGIVYLAMDHALQRRVALKEYMPSALAARGGGTEQVSIRSSSHAETFGIGLRSFVNEARLLAKFDNPALVKVHRFWEGNGTAYMVMPYYQGVTLKDARPALGGAPAEVWLRTLLDSILSALEVIHHEQIYHRDVSPPNIMLVGSPAWTSPRELKPVLLDFGAARHVIGDRTQTLTAILNPSFAPIEQYAESTALRQGPWTDLYALAGVIYFCLTGRPPVQAAARTIHDELPSLGAQQATLRSADGQPYTLEFLRAIDWCLSVKPNQRPENVQALRETLSGQRPLPEHVLANEAQNSAAVAAATAAALSGNTAFPPTQPAPSAYARTEADMPTRVMPPTTAPQAANPASAVAPAPTPTPAAPRPAPAAAPAAPAPAASPQPRAASATAPAATAPASGGSGRLVGIGAGVVALVAVLGFGAWKLMGNHGAADQAAAASAALPVPAAPVAVTTPPAPPAPVAASAAEATAVAPAVPAASAVPAAPVAEPAPVSPPPAVATRPAQSVQPAKRAEATRTPRPAETGAPGAHAAHGEPVAQPAAPAPAQPATPAPVAAAQPSATAEPKTPEICGKRVLFAYDYCMTRECKKPEYINLPQCERFKDKPVGRQP